MTYLHGFGGDPATCSIRGLIQEALPPNWDFAAPSYHGTPQLRDSTHLEAFLSELEGIVRKHREQRVHLVGFSVGGYLAAIFAERHPTLTASVLLLAPAIDNYERNFQSVPPAQWYMGCDYVQELQKLPARPSIDTSLVRTTIVHGQKDNDQGGADPSRVRKWVDSTLPNATLYTPDVDHNIPQWLRVREGLHGDRDGVPSFAHLLHLGWAAEARQQPNFVSKQLSCNGVHMLPVSHL